MKIYVSFNLELNWTHFLKHYSEPLEEKNGWPEYRELTAEKSTGEEGIAFEGSKGRSSCIPVMGSGHLSWQASGPLATMVRWGTAVWRKGAGTDFIPPQLRTASGGGLAPRCGNRFLTPAVLLCVLTSSKWSQLTSTPASSNCHHFHPWTSLVGTGLSTCSI